MELRTRAIGVSLDRIDGPKKVTGTAPYAVPVQSTSAKGRVFAVDGSAALALPRVLAVLSHENAPRLAPSGDVRLAVFQSAAVAYYGRFVAAVVADTLEVARQAASLV